MTDWSNINNFNGVLKSHPLDNIFRTLSVLLKALLTFWWILFGLPLLIHSAVQPLKKIENPLHQTTETETERCFVIFAKHLVGDDIVFSRCQTVVSKFGTIGTSDVSMPLWFFLFVPKWFIPQILQLCSCKQVKISNENFERRTFSRFLLIISV